MKVNVRFTSPLLRDSDDQYSRIVRALAEVAVQVNRSFLREYPATPRLYSSGVQYKNEPIGSVDELVDVPTICNRGWGDCFHLAAWRVAELREDGEERASIRVQRKRMTLGGRSAKVYHVLVRRGDGEIEDPSRLLGM